MVNGEIQIKNSQKNLDEIKMFLENLDVWNQQKNGNYLVDI
jgi:hypothetical protein